MTINGIFVILPSGEEEKPKLTRGDQTPPRHHPAILRVEGQGVASSVKISYFNSMGVDDDFGTKLPGPPTEVEIKNYGLTVDSAKLIALVAQPEPVSVLLSNVTFEAEVEVNPISMPALELKKYTNDLINVLKFRKKMEEVIVEITGEEGRRTVNKVGSDDEHPFTARDINNIINKSGIDSNIIQNMNSIGEPEAEPVPGLSGGKNTSRKGRKSNKKSKKMSKRNNKRK